MKKQLPAIISFIPAITLDSAAAVALLEPWLVPVSTRYILGAHLIASFLFLIAFQPALPPSLRRDKMTSSLLLLGFGLVLPAIGPLLALACVRFVLGAKSERTPENEYYIGEAPYLTNSIPAGIARRTSRSISELLHSPQVDVRRQAILAAANLEPKTAIPILRQAQQDSDEQVRIFARNLLSRIVENLESSLKLAQNSSLEISQQLERSIHVLDHYQLLVDLGLVSEGSKNAHISNALAQLAQVRLAQPDNEKTLCLLLKLHLLAGQVEEAKFCAQRLKEISRHPHITLPWELQVHYQNRDWTALQQLLSYLEENCFNDPQFRKIYAFWRRSA